MVQARPSSFFALAHGTSGLFPCRSMAWLSSRRSSKPSTRWWRAFSSSRRARSVSLGWAARRAGFSMTLLIGFFSIFHCIHLNLAPGEPEKHPVVPDAEAVFVLRTDQLLEVTLEASLKVVQPRPNALAQFLGQRAKLREGFVGEEQLEVSSSHSLSILRRFRVGARQCVQDFGGVAGQERCDGQVEAGEAAVHGSGKTALPFRLGPPHKRVGGLALNRLSGRKEAVQLH